MSRNDSRKRDYLSVVLSILLLSAYVYAVINSFIRDIGQSSTLFGYADWAHFLRSLREFVQFHVPYKDYFYEYGWFYLALSSFFYVIFGQTFLAMMISFLIFLPVLGLTISVYIAKLILRNIYSILLFLFLLLLFNANINYVSPRHLITELSLSLFIVYLLNHEKRYLYLSGIIGGLGLLTAIEYGLPLVVAVFITIAVIMVKKKKIDMSYLWFFLLQALVILPYYGWLALNGALRNHWHFTLGFINNFYFMSPCASGSFARLGSINEIKNTSQLIILGLPVEFLQQLNFYIVALFYFFVFIDQIYQLAKNKTIAMDSLIRLPLLIYGSLIYIRILDTPCVGNFNYGLVPFFLLAMLYLTDLAGLIRRKNLWPPLLLFLLLPVIWFIVTESNGYIVKWFGKKAEVSQIEIKTKTFNPTAGLYIDKELNREYSEVTEFIKSNTRESDYLYVYPWGVFNQTTGLRPPNSLTNALQYQIAGQEFANLTVTELADKKPKYIVINIYNNLGIAIYGKSRNDTGFFYSDESENGPVFTGQGDVVQKYILENYQTVFHNKIAIVMKKRENPIKLNEKYLPFLVQKEINANATQLSNMRWSDLGKDYLINGDHASLVVNLPKATSGQGIYAQFKIDGDFLTKHLSRYFINLYCIDEAGNQILVGKQLATKNDQTMKLSVASNNKIRAVKIEIAENRGFLWFLHPNKLKVLEVGVY